MRKRLILILLAASPVLAAQPFTVKGTVHGLSDRTIHLLSYYGERTFVIDSARADTAGMFRFDLPEKTPPGLYRVRIGKEGYIDLILNREDVEFSTRIEHPGDSLRILKSEENRVYYDFILRDSKAQAKLGLLQQVLDYYPDRDDYYAFTAKEYEMVQKGLAKIRDAAYKEHPGSYAARLIRLYSAPFLEASFTPEIRMAYLRQHFFDQTDFNDTSLLRSPAFSNKAISYLALYSNNRLAQKQLEAEFIKAVTVTLSAASVNAEVYKFLLDYLITGFDKYHFEEVITYMAENFSDPSACEDEDRKSALQKKLETYRKIAVGNPAPDFELPDPQGNPVKLSAVDAEYTLVIFYSGECSHCEEMMPKVKAIYDRQSPKRIEILAVSLDTDRQAWTDYLKTQGFNWINLCDFKGFDSPAADGYNIYATPTMFLLNRDKIILAKPISFRELEQVLNEKKLF